MRPPLQRDLNERRQETTTGFASGRFVRVLAEGVAHLQGWRRWVAALIAGAASILAMAPFHLYLILCVTLPVLLWLIEASPRRAPIATRFDLDRRRLLSAALVGWCFGYGFHVVGLYWLREAFLVTGGGLAMLWPLGVLGLPAFLAVFHGLAAACAVAIPGGPVVRVVALALALSATEWLRGNILTGFPWNILGLALTGPDILMQSSGLIGIYGLTLVTVLALAGPIVVFAAASRSARPTAMAWVASVLFAVPLLTMHGYGAWRLSAPPPPIVEGVRLRLVQPSIDQREKWQADKQLAHLHRQLELTRGGTDGRGMAGITHVVWPEASMPFLPLQRPQVLQAISEALPEGVHLLAGVLRMERRQPAETSNGAPPAIEPRVYNSLAVIDAEGRPVSVYDKTHLVPFGEYLPYQDLLESIGLQALVRQRGGFAVGPQPRPLLAVPGLAGAAALICYEAIFPGSTRLSQSRPSVLINITNDGWFGNSTGPRQHLHQARLRSVEEGLPMMRVANNGISAVYDAYGRQLARLDLDTAGVIDTELPGSLAPPLYSRLGDLPFWLIWCAGLTCLLRLARQKPT